MKRSILYVFGLLAALIPSMGHAAVRYGVTQDLTTGVSTLTVPGDIQIFDSTRSASTPANFEITGGSITRSAKITTNLLALGSGADPVTNSVALHSVGNVLFQNVNGTSLTLYASTGSSAYLIFKSSDSNTISLKRNYTGLNWNLLSFLNNSGSPIITMEGTTQNVLIGGSSGDTPRARFQSTNTSGSTGSQFIVSTGTTKLFEVNGASIALSVPLYLPDGSQFANQWTAVGNDIYNNNSGNIGLGTTSPSSKVDVFNGSVTIRGTNAALTTPLLVVTTMYFSAGVQPAIMGGRLTLSPGCSEAVTISSIANVSSICYAPYYSNLITLKDTNGRPFIAQFSSMTVSIAGLAANQLYDVFMSSTGSMNFSAAWSTWTVRANTVTFNTSWPVAMSTDTTRTYLGTFKTTGAGLTEDNASRRLLYNFYNGTCRRARQPTATTGNYTNSSLVWRTQNNDPNMRIDAVYGAVSAQSLSYSATIVAADGSSFCNVGISVDVSTPAVNGDGSSSIVETNDNSFRVPTCVTLSWDGVGFHQFFPVDRIQGGTSITVFGAPATDTSKSLAIAGRYCY